MANSASRIFKIMQNAGTDTISEIVFLKVKTIDPLVFNLENRVDITEEFYILSENIVIDKLKKDDILTAITFNGGQIYLVLQGLEKNFSQTEELKDEIDNIKSDLEKISDTVSKEDFDDLLLKVDTIETNISTLEERIAIIEEELNII